MNAEYASDVILFENDDGYRCLGCLLFPNSDVITWAARSEYAAYAHLTKHRRAGHRISQHTLSLFQ